MVKYFESYHMNILTNRQTDGTGRQTPPKLYTTLLRGWQNTPMLRSKYTKYSVNATRIAVCRSVQSCTAISRVHRRRIVKRPLDMEVSCEISRMSSYRISSRGPTAAASTGSGDDRRVAPSVDISVTILRRGE